MNPGDVDDLRLEHVYLLFTDIERSTDLWERAPDAMRSALRVHDDLVTAAIVDAGGAVLKRTGDGAVGTFASARQAVDTAATLQRTLLSTPALGDVGVRMGVHCGSLERRLGDLHGPEMNRAARITAAAHGGQILVSRTVHDDYDNHDEHSCDDHGHHGRDRRDGRQRHDSGDGNGRGEHHGAQRHGRDATVGFRSLGTHRLRGLLRPIELYQVVAPGLRDDFVAPATVTPEVGSLPPVPPSIIGRHDEIEAVGAAIAAGGLTTLTGPGGVGKTRLAVHVARTLLTEYGGGCWFVDLAPVAEHTAVLSTIATTLGVAGGTADLMLERVADRCSAAPTLLVVDNCEHVGEPVAATIAAIAAAAPTVTILCTSQRPLGCAGERLIRLEPLATDHGSDGSRSPAVELFHQRSTIARQGVPLAGFDERIEQICRELDGLPLAIELAAARCAVIDPDELAVGLGDRFALLRRRDGVARHRTLEAVIEWSYGLLDDDAQRQLRTLSAFHGPFDLAAAEAVSGRPALDDIAELVERSLVRRTGGGLMLLDSVRRFADARCRAAGEHGELAARHAQWVVTLAATPVDDPDADTVAARLAHLQSRSRDVRVGIEALIDSDPDQAVDVIVALADYWVASDIGAEPADLLLRAAPLAGDPARRVAAATMLACFGWIDGRNDVAEAAAREAIDVAERHGLPYPAFAASRLAVQLALSGAADEALEMTERALAALGDAHPERARIYGGLAVALFIGEHFERAVALADAGIAAGRADGTIKLMSAISNRLLVTPGAPETAPLADELAELAERLGRHAAAALALLTRANCARADGDAVGYLSMLAASVRTLYLCGRGTQLVSTLDYAAGALEEVGELHDAATMLGASAGLRPLVGLPAASVLPLAEVGERVRAAIGDIAYLRRFEAGRRLSLEAALELLDAVAAANATAAGSTRGLARGAARPTPTTP